MKLESIKVNGEELTKEQIANLFVNDSQRGYYVKGLNKYDDVVISLLNEGYPLDLKIKDNLCTLSFDSFKFVYIKKGYTWSTVTDRLKSEPYPVKLLFGVTDRVGYNRLFIRGFAYFNSGTIDFEANDFDSEWLLTEEIKQDKDLKVKD